jgi:branched-chain amino acid transport system substrate-binding protein
MVRRLQAFLFTALLLAGCSSRSGSEPILIGHIAPLSTPAGEHTKQGILLAVEEVNEGDKVAGQKVTVLHVDSRGDAAVAQAEAVRLAGVNKVAALLIDAEPGTVERAAKELETYAIPLFTPAVLSAPPSGENLFAVNLTAPRQGRALARYTAQQLKPGRVAVLADSHTTGGMALAAEFVKEMPKNGPRVEQWSFEKPAEFPDLAARIKKMQPDAVLFAGSPADLPALRTQLQNAEVRGPMLFGGDDLAAIPAEAREDVYLATCFAPEFDDVDKDFVRKYRDRFHEAPDIHTALAFESSKLLFKAMNQAKTATGAAVRKELVESDSFAGVTGSLSFAKDRVAKRPALIVHWKDGQAKVVQTDKEDK